MTIPGQHVMSGVTSQNSISECEPFFQRKFKIFKGFWLFEFKMIYFMLYFKEFKESKYLNGVQNFLLNNLFI
jgi:hypothetical protein